MSIMGELGFFLNFSSCNGKSLENCSNVGSFLHRDDPQLIFFVDPDEESLGIVVEDTSALWPVAVETAGLEETITLPENLNKISKQSSI